MAAYQTDVPWWMLSQREARRYILSLERSSRREVFWNRRFTYKPLHERLAILRDGWPPVAALNMAALCVQRWARGHRARVLVVMSTVGSGGTAGHGGRVPAASRAAAAAAGRADQMARIRRRERMAREASTSAGDQTALSGTEATLISRFLEAKLRQAAYGYPELDFHTWALTRLQAWFRMVPWHRYFRLVRSPLLLLGAASIQYEWRSREYARRKRKSPRRRRRQSPELRAALLMQERWRRYTNRMIFRYFRDLIYFREQGDPAQLLKSINPKEASLMDTALAVHVRFRLGGAAYPPTIYYKVFTHGAVTDVCSFAPRDYTRHKQADPITLHNKDKPGQLANSSDRAGWYRRVENNGWRPVSDKLLHSVDEVTMRTAAAAVDWSHLRVQRREALARKKKEKKLQWLTAMYDQGRSQLKEGRAQLREGAEDGRGALGEGEEDELDELLQWSDALDFDSYHQDWLGLATSARQPPSSWPAGSSLNAVRGISPTR